MKPLSKAIISISFLLLNSIVGFSQSNDSIVNSDSVRNSFNKQIDNAIDSITKMNLRYKFGVFLDEEGEFELAANQFNKALEIAIAATNDSVITDIANYLGNEYAMLGNFELSNSAYMKALEAAQKMNDAGEIAKISGNLAGNYMMAGDYDLAIDFGLYALQIKESNNNLTRICYHYITVGNIFKETGNLEKWESYILKAYAMKDVEDCANFGDRAKIYNSLGGIAEQRNDLEKAISYYDTLKTISTEANFVQGISTALVNGADIYKHQKNYEQALEMANEAEQYFGESPYDLIFNNNFKAEIHELMGNYEKGVELVMVNINMKEIDSYKTEKFKSLELLYKLNADLENYKLALDWNDSLRIFENEMRDQEIIKSIEELETKYQTEQKEQQIELLTAENEIKNQRLQLGVGVLTLLFLTIFLILVILRVRKKQAELIQNNLQQQVLRSQMNPHFIFNVLGSIQNFMLANDTKKAAGYLTRFASLTRSTLEFSSEESISLEREIEMLKNYIELEQMRLPNKFSYKIVADENLESDFIDIPPMIIQPFIENSIKHGFKTIDYQGELVIRITDRMKYIEFEIEDNGTGMIEKKETDPLHKSMAMTIFEKRRKLIQKQHKKEVYFERIDIRKSGQNSGVKIIIKLPVL